MASKIYECIEKIGNRIIEEKEFLTELDREIGDADHGINMARGFTEVLGVLSKDSDNIGELLKKTGILSTAPLICRPAKSAQARHLLRLKTARLFLMQ